jgi:hypothetical protein
MTYLIISSLVGVTISLICFAFVVYLNKHIFKITKVHRNKFNIIIATAFVVISTMPPAQDFLLETIFPTQANSVRLERMMQNMVKKKKFYSQKMKSFVKLTFDDYQKALLVMGQKIDQASLVRLSTIMNMGKKAPHSDACWAIKTMLEYINNYPQAEETKVLLSYLAQIMAASA